MFQNRHRCCICHEPRKHVQIHHIDENPANNNWGNLAVLCVDCHSLVTGDQGFGKKYSAREVALYKSNWEQQCSAFHQQEAGGDDNDEEEGGDGEPADSYYTDTILLGNSHISRHYKLDAGDEIKIWTESDEPLDIMIMTTRQYNLWAEDQGDEDVKFIEYHDDQYEVRTSRIVSRNGNYTVVVCNNSDEDVRVQLDVSIWE
jgi:hypothetical protein